MGPGKAFGSNRALEEALAGTGPFEQRREGGWSVTLTGRGRSLLDRGQSKRQGSEAGECPEPPETNTA